MSGSGSRFWAFRSQGTIAFMKSLDAIKIEVYDWDMTTKNDLIGRADLQLPLLGITPAGPEALTPVVLLDDKGKSVGKIEGTGAVEVKP